MTERPISADTQRNIDAGVRNIGDLVRITRSGYTYNGRLALVIHATLQHNMIGYRSCNVIVLGRGDSPVTLRNQDLEMVVPASDALTQTLIDLGYDA